MFRFWLLLVTAMSLLVVVILAMTLFLGSREVEVNFHAYRVAQSTYDRYEQVAHEAYRYFKGRIDRLATGQPQSPQESSTHRERLAEAIQSLRKLVIEHADDDPEQRDELARVAGVTSFLDESQFRFDEIEHRLILNQGDAAKIALRQFSLDEIDRFFQPLMDESIRRQHQRALEAENALNTLIARFQWFSIIAGVVAALISLFGGLWLTHRLKISIGGLMAGTEAIAKGQLDIRIDNRRHDEFGMLAANFNQMATTLELQRDALCERQNELELRVLERTEELRTLNADLRRMDEDRRRFLSDVSHELRTPITVIRGEAEIALRQANVDPEPFRIVLRRIIELSVQLGTYVGDLLMKARAEESPRDNLRQPVNLGDLVDKIALDLQILGQDNHIEVRILRPEKTVWVMGDEIRLRQALIILGDNACRYSYAQGSVMIRVDSSVEHAILEVIDQGIGIASDDQTKIFERSYRGAAARERSPDGLGLGLSMVKAIIESHGGTVTFTSNDSKGTTFRIQLPIALIPDHDHL